MAVRRHENEGSSGFRSVGCCLGGKDDSLGIEVTGESLPERVVLHPADKPGIATDGCKAGNRIGHGAAGHHRDGLAGVEKPRRHAVIDKVHAVLGEIEVRQKGLIDLGNNVNDRVSDAENIDAWLVHVRRRHLLPVRASIDVGHSLASLAGGRPATPYSAPA